MENKQICEGPIYNECYGWICPKCGTSVSPDIKTCPHCSTNRTVIYTPKNSDTTSCTWSENLNTGEQMIFS